MGLDKGNIFKHIVLVVVGLVGATIIIFLINHYNAGVSPDSVVYISVARNLAAGNGFVAFDGTPFVQQPPLYPILLASTKFILSIDPATSAGYLNALMFCLTVYLSGYFLLRHVKSLPLVIIGTTFVLISSALMQNSLMVLSETLFITLVLLSMTFFHRYLTRKNLTNLILFSFSAGLVCITRYTGIVIIITGLCFIILSEHRNKAERIQQSLIFLFISSTPLCVWLVRDFILSRTLVGQRGTSSFTLSQNLKLFYCTTLQWYLPLNAVSTGFILIFVIISAWIFSESGWKKTLNYEVIKIIFPSLLFVLLYSGLIIVSSTTTAYDTIADRLLSPIIIPTLFIVFVIMDRAIILLKKYFHHRLIFSLYIVGLLLLINYQVKNTIHIIEGHIAYGGWGYSSKSWRESETIKFLNKHPKLMQNKTVFSNEPEAVYILTNIKSQRSPAKTFYNSTQQFDSNSLNADQWATKKNKWLVWFDNADRSFLYSIDELLSQYQMTEVSHFVDGKLFILSD
jgi:hypothetical protein